ncbi:hypothetical protein VOLCADRAFT_93466 [Volvox carteri f. nagariensis]|uniref:Uncharacterized protein n=1 Tax=Volvox carteri f. nagariensis TaxID=3068 RepID=D8U270_VOLCA|nr:uncharacterized protein VOLCADRAFT_93466 [Volvox carteri f. nagariensis]EFJ46314.1 hypothetical protein VOLCADRAFT_93466 [Volvox carteri f. nagariensis]|eukprot:XP_002952761.1 hypothetical protein VOLCADRAFT_93466 [Volvox carteri f. nagariensis]
MSASKPSRPSEARRESSRIAVPLARRRVTVHYTSQQGRMGEGGEEETSLRDTVNKLTSEKQYGGTFRVGATGGSGSSSSSSGGGGGGITRDVDEEKEPGYHHESRKDLEKRGAVVHEEVGGRQGHHPSPASAPESGTECRTAGSGAGTESARTASTGGRGGRGSEDDISSAPESGTEACEKRRWIAPRPCSSQQSEVLLVSIFFFFFFFFYFPENAQRIS